MTDILDKLRNLPELTPFEFFATYRSVIREAIAEIEALRVPRSPFVDHEDLRNIDGVLAQLRHAYALLVGTKVVDQTNFANGLIAPQIRTLERLRKLLS